MGRKILPLFLAVTIGVGLLSAEALAAGDAAGPAEAAEITSPEEAPAGESPAEETPTGTAAPSGTEIAWEEAAFAGEDAEDGDEPLPAGSGSCGEGLIWTLADDVLTVSGAGDMDDYDEGTAPWSAYRDGIAAVTIEDGVTGIGDNAFSGCPSLTAVTIPDSVIRIGQSAFSNCSGLADIVIPDSVTGLGSAAFSKCRRLKTVSLGRGLTEIGYRTFYNCTRLVSVAIPEGVTAIGGGAFSNCSGLADIVIPDSVTSLGSNVFSDCTGLETVTIGAGLTDVGSEAFNGCSSLTAFAVSENSGSYSAADGVLYNRDKTALIRYPMGKTDAFFTVPDSVKTIGECAFSGCEILTGVTMGGVTAIENYAFESCVSLAAVALPDGVAHIGSHAFYCCESLADIALPAALRSIGDYAFAQSALTGLAVPEGVETIGAWAFDSCADLTFIAFSGGVPEIGEDAFGGVSALACYRADVPGWAEAAKSGFGGELVWSRLAVTAAENALPADALALLDFEVRRYAAYDVALPDADGAEPAGLAGGVTVSIPLPYGYGENSRVYYWDGETAPKDMNAGYDSDAGTLTFTAARLGVYAVVQEKLAAEALPSGDANGDGRLTLSDAMTIIRAVVGLCEIQDADLAKAADVNGDGSITPLDALLAAYQIPRE